MKRYIKILALFVPLIFFPFAAGATSINTQVESPIYRAIDRLIAAGAVDGVVVGQKPYSNNEIGRILREAEGNIEGLKNPADKMMVYRILKRWKNYYCLEPKWDFHLLERLDINYNYLDSPDRPVFANGLGNVAAHVRPITSNEEGRHFADGINYSIETYHWLKGPIFAFFAQPRFQLQGAKGGNGEAGVFVQKLYGKLGLGNFEVEAGRDEVVWGQGEFGGLMLSNNARPLDMVKLSNDHPLNTGAIGFLKASILLANLGPHYNYKYSYLTAWKLSLLPADFAEIGVHYGFIMGGRDAPHAGALNVARHFFGFIPRISNNATGSDRGGADFRFRIPSLSGLEFYGEVYLENINLAHPRVAFGDKAAYSGGLYLPRIGGSNHMAVRLNYVHTGPYIYRDSVWQGGFALSGEFLGDPIGPNADGVHLNYYYDLGLSSRFIAQVAFENRGGDLFTAKADGTPVISTGRPSERRYRGVAILESQLSKIIRARFNFGYEAIDNFNFVRGDGKSSIIGGINLSFSEVP